MGNNNTSWKSPVGDDTDEMEVQEWLKWKGAPASSRNGKVQKMFPGLDVLAVQPVYLSENLTNSKKKHTRYAANQKLIKGMPLSRSSSFGEDSPLDYGEDITTTKLTATDNHETTTNNNLIGLNDLKQRGFLAEMDHQSLSDLQGLDESECKFPTGELNVSLSYDPTSDRMKIFIIKAKNLSCKPHGGKHDKFGVSCSESYINVTLTAHSNLKQTFSTTPKKNGHVEILFYENFAFYLKKNSLKTAILEIKAMHKCKNILKNSHVVGRVLIGGKSINDVTETKQWYDAIANPRQVITKWHTFWC